MLTFCMKKMDLKSSECMMVGDSNNDIIPANELGMDSVFVSYGYGKLEQKVEPKYSIERIDEILQLIWGQSNLNSFIKKEIDFI